MGAQIHVLPFLELVILSALKKVARLGRKYCPFEEKKSLFYYKNTGKWK